MSYHVSKLINRAAELLGVDILRELHEVEGQGSVSGRKCARAASKIRERHRLISIDVRDGADRIAELQAQLEAARKDVEKLRALYRAMREPMAMIGMDKHIGPFSDEAIALLDAMNALDGGTYSKSEGS